jgi:hypothetical protein
MRVAEGSVEVVVALRGQMTQINKIFSISENGLNPQRMPPKTELPFLLIQNDTKNLLAQGPLN